MKDERELSAVPSSLPRIEERPMPLTYSIRRFTFALMAFFSFLRPG